MTKLQPEWTADDERDTRAVNAGDLNVSHIGQVVRFRTWDPDREITTVITAELRQINHDGTSTSMHYGLMAEREQEFEHGDTLILEPRTDYADIPRLLGNDPREADEHHP